MEPDPSDEVGRGALIRLSPGPTVEVVDAIGEGSRSLTMADFVYDRQVLHHAKDLNGMVADSPASSSPVACSLTSPGSHGR